MVPSVPVVKPWGVGVSGLPLAVAWPGGTAPAAGLNDRKTWVPAGNLSPAASLGVTITVVVPGNGVGVNSYLASGPAAWAGDSSDGTSRATTIDSTATSARRIVRGLGWGRVGSASGDAEDSCSVTRLPSS